MKTKIKKYTAFLLAMLMVVAMIPMSASAANLITINPATGNGSGSVTANPTTPIDGQPVTLTVAVGNDSVLKSLTVTASISGAISPTNNQDGTYTFTYDETAMGDITVGAEFAKKITHNTGTNGTVTVTPLDPALNGVVTITAVPDGAPTSDYVVSQVTVKNLATNKDIYYKTDKIHPTENKYTFNYPKDGIVEIDVQFAKKVVVLNPAPANGTVAVDKHNPDSGQTVTITATGNTMYAPKTPVVKNGNTEVPVTMNSANGTYTFKYVAGAAMTVDAQFEEKIKIQPSANTNGSVTVGEYNPANGETVTITATPNTNYAVNVGQVTVKNGTTKLAVTEKKFGTYSTYTFKYPVNGIVTIDVLFTSGIIVSKVDNGAINVNTAAPADKEKVIITAIPDPGYRVSSVTAKNGSATVALTDEGNGEYSFIYAKGMTVTISAVFASSGIDIKKPVNGTVTVDKSAPKAGETVTITTTPEKGYALKTMSVKNGSAALTVKDNGDGTHTFTYPTGTNIIVTIETEFVRGVSVAKADHGTVKADKMLPNKNDTVILTVTPDKGYKLDTLTVKNGTAPLTVNKNANGIYSFIYPENGTVHVEATFIVSIPFTDVPTDQWYFNAVVFAYENSLFDGTSKTTFSPNNNMTRAMMVQVLFNMTDDAKKGTVKFTDVPDGQWYSDAVSWAATNKVVDGIGDNKFAPLKDITREQMAQMLYNYAKVMKIDLPKTRATGSFADAGAISSWAKEAVEAMYAAEIINGKEGNRFDPQGKATRAQVAEMFMNFVNVTKK